MNYFELYEIPTAFMVDEAAVRRIYLQNSKKYHPDFHTLADEVAQAAVLEMATMNNKAFKTLSSLESRIRYILELKGLLGENSKAPPLPQDFLMDMMDINEALMDLEFDNDESRLQETREQVQSLENELQTSIAPTLLGWSENTENGDDLKLVQDFFFKMQYLLRIKENLSKFAPA